MFNYQAHIKLHIFIQFIYTEVVHGETWHIFFRSYRLAAYRQFTYWIYGKLGKKNRIPIPSCVVKAVRHQYPEEDGIYEGYHEARL